MAVRFLPVLLLLSLVTLAACETHEQVPLVAENDPVTLRLAEAADKAANALNDIASIRRLEKLPEAAPDPMSVPPILQQPITVTWDGPLEVMAKALADRIGYRFLVTGKRSPLPIMVSINATNQPTILVLHDLGLQMGGRGELIVDGVTQRIEISYVAVDHASP